MEKNCTFLEVCFLETFIFVILAYTIINYQIRALTKGCYSFNVITDLFDSSKMSVPFYQGDQKVLCHTYHLAAFSIGLMNPLIPVDFDYQYIMDVKPVRDNTITRKLLVEKYNRKFAEVANKP